MTYQKPIKLKNSKEAGQIRSGLAIIFCLVFLSVACLVELNGMVAKNFELRKMTEVLEQKEAKNQELLVKLMKVRSLDNLESAAKNLNLVSIEKIGYLKLGPNAVALSD
ncbi:MAG: hypothetical protein AAB724_02160 [Patescibacteria group bacterium]